MKKEKIKLNIVKNIKADFRQISRPSKKELISSWGIVILISGLSGAIVFGFDALGTLISQSVFL